MFSPRTGSRPGHMFNPRHLLVRTCFTALIAFSAISGIFALAQPPAVAQVSLTNQYRSMGAGAPFAECQNVQTLVPCPSDSEPQSSARQPRPMPRMLWLPTALICGLLIAALVLLTVLAQLQGKSRTKTAARTGATICGVPLAPIQPVRAGLRHEVEFTDIPGQISGVHGASNLVLLEIRTGSHSTRHVLWDLGQMHCQLGAARKRESKEKMRERAVHKLGHAIVYYVLSGEEPFVSMSVLDDDCFQPINPYTQRRIFSVDELHDRLAAAIGGAKAQQLFFHAVDKAGERDISSAARLAHLLVAELGLFDSGRLKTLQEEENALLTAAERKVENIIVAQERQFNAMVRALLERGSLSGQEFVELWQSMQTIPVPRRW